MTYQQNEKHRTYEDVVEVVFELPRAPDIVRRVASVSTSLKSSVGDIEVSQATGIEQALDRHSTGIRQAFGL